VTTPPLALTPAARPSHDLAAVAAHLPGAELDQLEPVAAGDIGRLQVTGLTLASGRVTPGDLFAALPGLKTHGAKYAQVALEAGAAAVLTDPAGAALVPAGTPLVVAPEIRAHLGALAAWFYGHPAADLTTVGVTGTNGKTTVAHMVQAALAEDLGQVGLLGTIMAAVGEVRIASQRTTLEAPDLQAAFAAMRERGVAACVMEVSSHAIDQHRVDGFQFDVAAFTNLSRDHLDYHGTMEAYFEAKARLFTPAHAKRAIINLEDPWGASLARLAGVPAETISRQAGAADWHLQAGVPSRGRTAFTLVGPGGRQLAGEVDIPGDYNVANAAVALLVAVAAGASPEGAARGIAGLPGVPGRMEKVPGPAHAPLVVVDYAHAPESVAQALAALRPHTAGRLIAVVGAGGDRDHGKRPLMGAAAAAGADVVFVTDDNPRSEPPGAIRAVVFEAASRAMRRKAQARGQVFEVAERDQAIERAIAGAGPDDTVVILGKGHEATIDYGGILVEHSDRECAQRVLAKQRGVGA
jgi:UDP-N-acetylmuramoyl-L-alanyl-D-glutamate--2,6-diaminopimelate ligase